MLIRLILIVILYLVMKNIIKFAILYLKARKVLRNAGQGQGVHEDERSTGGEQNSKTFDAEYKVMSDSDD